MTQDWFHRLVGFREENYDVTRERLRVEGDELVSTVNDKRYGIGSLSVPTLAELRSRIEVPAPRSQHGAVCHRGRAGDACRAGTRGRAVPGRVAVQPPRDDGTDRHSGARGHAVRR